MLIHQRGSLSRRKFLTNRLEESGMLEIKPIDTPMDPIGRFDRNLGGALNDHGQYQSLIGARIYLIVTKLKQLPCRCNK